MKNNGNYSSEIIAAEKDRVYRKLFYSLKEELSNCKKYFYLIDSAEIIGDSSLRAIFIKFANQCIERFDIINKEISIICPEAICECLYGLVDYLLKEADELREKLSIYK